MFVRYADLSELSIFSYVRTGVRLQISVVMEIQFTSRRLLSVLVLVVMIINANSKPLSLGEAIEVYFTSEKVTGKNETATHWADSGTVTSVDADEATDKTRDLSPSKKTDTATETEGNSDTSEVDTNTENTASERANRTASAVSKISSDSQREMTPGLATSVDADKILSPAGTLSDAEAATVWDADEKESSDVSEKNSSASAAVGSASQTEGRDSGTTADTGVNKQVDLNEAKVLDSPLVATGSIDELARNDSSDKGVNSSLATVTDLGAAKGKHSKFGSSLDIAKESDSSAVVGADGLYSSAAAENSHSKASADASGQLSLITFTATDSDAAASDLTDASSASSGAEKGVDKSSGSVSETETGTDKSIRADSGAETEVHKTSGLGSGAKTVDKSSGSVSETGTDKSIRADSGAETGVDKSSKSYSAAETGVHKSSGLDSDAETGVDKSSGSVFETETGTDKSIRTDSGAETEGDKSIGANSGAKTEGDKSIGADSGAETGADKSSGSDSGAETLADKSSGLDSGAETGADKNIGTDSGVETGTDKSSGSDSGAERVRDSESENGSNSEATETDSEAASGADSAVASELDSTGSLVFIPEVAIELNSEAVTGSGSNVASVLGCEGKNGTKSMTNLRSPEILDIIFFVDGGKGDSNSAKSGINEEGKTNIFETTDSDSETSAGLHSSGSSASSSTSTSSSGGNMMSQNLSLERVMDSVVDMMKIVEEKGKLESRLEDAAEENLKGGK